MGAIGGHMQTQPGRMPDWVPEGIDLTRPSASRVYDYYLGGFHNFDVDREMARQAIEDWPDLPIFMRSNRAFLRRSVSRMIGLGVRQFLDIGSGIPTVGNVHEVAQSQAPDAKVVYVDIDPVAVAHSQAILRGNPNAAVVRGDFRRPEEVLADPVVTEVLDLRRPVALLLVALLHFVADDDAPAEVLRAYRERLPPGSYLVLSHATHEFHPPELTASHRALYRRTATPMTMRSKLEVEALFDGFEPVSPGVVLSELWHPDPGTTVKNPERIPMWVGAGRRA
jgi:S-adenosyl methyltransferase